MPRVVRLCLTAVLSVVVAAFVADACGIDLLPRAHYNDTMWRPLARQHTSFTAGPGHVLDAPFAGMRAANGDTPMDRVRKAYQVLAGDHDGEAEAPIAAAENAIAAARLASPTALERDELDLVALKVRMRAKERDQSMEDWPAIAQAFQQFLSRSLTPAVASEARGWLAHCYFRADDHPSAARIYLDELARPETVFAPESLDLSLRMLYLWNGTDTGLIEDLEKFFDTPSHALFAVTMATNPVSDDGISWELQWGRKMPPEQATDPKQRTAYRDRIATRALSVLRSRADLFRGPDGDALAAALMRAALYQGDAAAALMYHDRLGAESPMRTDPDVRWQRVSALALTGKFAEARVVARGLLEEPSLQGSAAERAAARALVGLSMRLGDNVTALEGAFRYQVRRSEDLDLPLGRWMVSPVVDGDGWPIDLPYLLDVWLSDAELDRARRTLPTSLLSASADIGAYGEPRWTVAREIDYARAVRRARAERYDESAALYQRAGNPQRAARMRRLAPIAAKAKAPEASIADRVAYATALAAQTERVFFHDRLWLGYQRYMLGTNYNCWAETCPPIDLDASVESMPPAMQREYVRRERRFRDRQEERWRAAQIGLDIIANDNGTTDGRAAAMLALDCLAKINTDRFGRAREIAALQRRVGRWLRAHP